MSPTVADRPKEPRSNVDDVAPLSAADRDRQWIARFRQGDETAFEELFRLHFQPTCDHLRRRTDDAQSAEDAAQVAFLSAYYELRRDKRDIHFSSWIQRIARNALTDLWRRSQSQKRGGDQIKVEYDSLADRLLNGVAPAASIPSLSIQDRETVELFWAAASTLSRDQYHVLLLRVKLGLSSKEAAESLRRTPNAINALLVKAKRNLPRAGYAMLAKGAPRCIPCGELRALVAAFEPGPLTRQEREKVSRHVRCCAICQQHRQHIPRTAMFTPLLWRPAHALLADAPIQSLGSEPLPPARASLWPTVENTVRLPPPRPAHRPVSLVAVAST